MKDLALTIAAADICCSHFDGGGFDIDEDEFLDEMKSDSSLKGIVTKAEIEAFCEDFDAWDFMYDKKPHDPNDDSRAHNLWISFSRIPADVDEEDVTTAWIKKRIKAAEEKDVTNGK